MTRYLRMSVAAFAALGVLLVGCEVDSTDDGTDTPVDDGMDEPADDDTDNG
jgi:hypothetical protein